MGDFSNITYLIPLIQYSFLCWGSFTKPSALPFNWAKIFISSFTAFRCMINPKLSLAFADTKTFLNLNKKKWQQLIPTNFWKLHYNLHACLVFLWSSDLFSRSSWHLANLSQQWKHRSNVWNLFKVNNKSTGMTSMTLFLCFYC